MARKRYKTKRMDYRKGGRVSLKHGGKPIRKDYGNKDEFQIALEQWKDNPAHTTTTTATTTVQDAADQATKGRVATARLGRIERTGPKIEDFSLSSVGTGEDKGIAKIDPAEVIRIGNEGDADRVKIRGDKNLSMDKTGNQYLMGQWDDGNRKIVDPVVTKAGADVSGDSKKEKVSSATAAQADAVTRDAYDPATMTAVKAGDMVNTTGAVGELSPEALAKVEEIRTLSGDNVAAQISAQAIEASKAENVEAVISAGAFVPEVIGVAAQLSPTAAAEKETRTAITGSAPTAEEAQLINSLGFEAAQRQTVTGTAAKGDAASMLAQTAAIPEDIAASIVEDPSAVEAKIASEDVEVQAAIAALPTEALVSSQMEALIGGLQDGEIPAWAKPAIASIEQNLAMRGMDVSTVGRDALFNAIIQSALPLAQSNAQALQARANQNLSNEQQANVLEAQQEQQLRMQNLANRQDSGSQTAQLAQQLKVQQGQFKQEATLSSAQQQQQTKLQNLQNLQQATNANASNQQALNLQELGIEAQLELSELQIMDATNRENMSAVQQGKLLEFNTAADFMSKNAAFTQEMRKANLSTEQQIQLANLSAQNQASSDNLSVAQATELANLNARMQTNLKSSELAQQMNLAQLNVDQQRAIENATMVSKMDLTKFSTAQQVELANSQLMSTSNIANMNSEQQSIMQQATALASLDLANVDQRTKLASQNAATFLQMDMANLTNQQQALILKDQQTQQRLLSDQAAQNAAAQFNSTSENQTNQFLTNLGAQLNQTNIASQNAMRQFNAANANATEARRVGQELDISKFNAQLATSVSESKAQKAFLRDQFNAKNATMIESGNVEFMRKANTANTAAKNAAITLNATNAMGLTSQQLAFLTQELRDEATFDATFANNERERLAQVYAAALGSNSYSEDNESWGTILAAFGSIINPP